MNGIHCTSCWSLELHQLGTSSHSDPFFESRRSVSRFRTDLLIKRDKHSYPKDGSNKSEHRSTPPPDEHVPLPTAQEHPARPFLSTGESRTPHPLLPSTSSAPFPSLPWQEAGFGECGTSASLGIKREYLVPITLLRKFLNAFSQLFQSNAAVKTGFRLFLAHHSVFKKQLNSSNSSSKLNTQDTS